MECVSWMQRYGNNVEIDLNALNDDKNIIQRDLLLEEEYIEHLNLPNINYNWDINLRRVLENRRGFNCLYCRL